ncbi:MAG: bifunctional 2-polyprenyl-6-hydroxyphenol methylase/3-demethylubiquinol 3-O-methyltransferase UbiG [Janthinobacterium lividum]
MTPSPDISPALPAASIDPASAGFFGALAGDWWDPHGSSAMLHRINPLRLAYIRDAAVRRFDRSARDRRPLAGLTALDVGCGAGLLAEPLARMGATVTGIDAAAANIAVATAHAAAAGLDIAYRSEAVEQVDAGFDLVTCLEVVEHVADRAVFLAGLRRLVRPGGLLVMSTPNRTALSYATLIVGAERIARSIPRGAHDWHRFVTPDELTAELAAAGFTVGDVTGLTWRPGTGFVLGRDTSINYYLTATPS